MATGFCGRRECGHSEGSHWEVNGPDLSIAGHCSWSRCGCTGYLPPRPSSEGEALTQLAEQREEPMIAEALWDRAVDASVSTVPGDVVSDNERVGRWTADAGVMALVTGKAYIAPLGTPPPTSDNLGAAWQPVGTVVCCSSHNGGSLIGRCCDPDDCGPCCENCPTCPTLIKGRLFPEAVRRSNEAYARGREHAVAEVAETERLAYERGRRELAQRLRLRVERGSMDDVLDMIETEAER